MKTMVHDLQEIEWDGGYGDPVYLRFSHKPVAKTEAYLLGDVNVDLDSDDQVIGVEMLSADPKEWEILGKIGTQRNLRFDLFLTARGPAKPK